MINYRLMFCEMQRPIKRELRNLSFKNETISGCSLWRIKMSEEAKITLARTVSWKQGMFIAQIGRASCRERV